MKKQSAAKDLALNHNKSKSPALRYHRPNRLFFIFTLVVFAIAGYFLLSSKAATPPAVYLTPATRVLPVSTTFTVQVREDSGSTPVNAVQSNFSYPTNLVSFVSIDTTGTAFSSVAQSSGGSGQVTIAQGSTTPRTGDQLIATITFTSLTTGGAAAMAFTSGTALVSSSSNSDILGSLSATTGGTYTIDTVPPVVSITSPAGGANLGVGGTINVALTATDALSTISTVDLFIDNVKVTTFSTAGPSYNYSWATTGLSLTTHTLRATATDSAGNSGNSTTNTITLADLTAPSLPSTLRTTARTTNSIALAWNGSTDNIGVTGYRIMRGATTLTTTTLLTYTDSGLTANTSYNYSVVALDAAGNASTAATLATSTITAVVGDINGDTHVTIVDLSMLLSDYGTSAARSDIHVDGIVNLLDLSVLLSNYGV